MEAHVDFGALRGGSERGDFGGRVVDQEAVTFARRGERLLRACWRARRWR